jgi:hypothetical protein
VLNVKSQVFFHIFILREFVQKVIVMYSVKLLVLCVFENYNSCRYKVAITYFVL